MDTKPWYQSKTIWGVVVAFLAQILKPRGVDISAESPQLVDGILNVVSFAATLFAIYGRIRASKLIKPKSDDTTVGGPLMHVLLAAAIIGCSLTLPSCVEGPVYPKSPVAVVGDDFHKAAAEALQAYAEYKAGNANITWALVKMFNAYSLYTKSAPDVKALITAWTGNAGDSQELADRLVRIFGSSSAPPETKMAALALIASDTAASAAQRRLR
jgi:hypothetical protein